jgi:hypothetical protein
MEDYASEDSWIDYDEEDSYTNVYENLARYEMLNLTNDGVEMHWIFTHIDDFVGHCRGNESVTEVTLYPSRPVHGHQGDDAWDKFGQAIGNLQGLTLLHICPPSDFIDDDDGDDVGLVVPIPDWDILARILSHVRQSITLTVTIDAVHKSPWRVEHSRSLARAIHGHPTITCFEAGSNFSCGALDALYSALTTLPALTSISLSYDGNNTPMEEEDEESSASASACRYDSLTELLRLPSLRSVCFASFFFTRGLCQATANALMEGTAVTKLEFRKCKLFGEYAAIMASGFSRNTSVSCIGVVMPVDDTIHAALALALPSNSTLRELYLEVDDDCDGNLYWSPIMLALGKNTGLKRLIFDGLGSMEESLCIAMKDGLTLNETLESLQLYNVHLRDAEFAFWCRAFSFLRTNKALTSLTIGAVLGFVGTQSCRSAFCCDITAMLAENVSLEVLAIKSWNTANFVAEDYLALVSALKGNKTLKTLRFCDYVYLELTADEDKQMAAVLRKNYGLERLPDIILNDRAGDVGAILRLNAAGRRYLVQDGSSISKGVEVLSRVNDDINCVFLHLLDNPRLCDRSAVEARDADQRSSSSTSAATARRRSGEGKRERAVGDKGKESRRRLA